MILPESVVLMLQANTDTIWGQPNQSQAILVNMDH